VVEARGEDSFDFPEAINTLKKALIRVIGIYHKKLAVQTSPSSE
jgi:hypothetical protein